MRMVFAALFLLPLFLFQNASAADVNAGKAAWNAKFCKNCHGNEGEGAYGPDLAGRGLSAEQFKHAVRKPWGVMPAFTERQVSDQMLGDISAYLSSLPKVAEPAAWHLPVPDGDAPRGQVLLIANGCGQCHGPELRNPRMALGGDASEADFAYFAKRVYEHTDLYPDGRMGNFSKLRLPEPVLQEIFRFAKDDLGLLVPISAKVMPGVSDGANTTYSLALKNDGAKGKGLTAEDITISLVVAPGTTIVNATGDGYQGVKKDPKTNADLAVWQVAQMAPQDVQTYTLTVSGKAGAAPEVLKGSMVSWAKPEMRKGVPNLALRDPLMPGKEMRNPVTFPPPPKG